MKPSLLAALLLLGACRSTAEATADGAVHRDSATPEDTAAEDSGEAVDTGACAEEGQACVTYEEDQSELGLNNCCLSRQTCYPEGCYYSLPD